MTETTYQRPLTIGEMIDVFRIERVLGAGGFGITYLATDTTLNCQVALKEYFPQNAWREQHSRVVRTNEGDSSQSFQVGLERFHKEGQALALFSHPNIVRVKRLLVANSTAYLVMDYEHGETLESYLQRLGRPLTYQEAEAIFDPLLDGLRAIHERNLLHLDIKPANIFLRGDGIPVLIDFGGARHQLGQASRLVSFLVASDGYAPNEQYSGSQLQSSADIYAVGATLYFSITGRVPADSPIRANALIDGGADPLLPVSQLVRSGTYPTHFLQALEASLDMRAAKRPQSVKEFQQHMFTPSQPPSQPSSFQPSQPRAMPQEQQGQTSTNWMPLLLGMGGIVILLLGVVSAKLLMTPTQAAPEVAAAVAASTQTNEAIRQLQEQNTLTEAKRQAAEITQQAEQQAQQRLAEADAMANAAAEAQQKAELHAKEAELQQREAKLKQLEQQRTARPAKQPDSVATSLDTSAWYQVDASPALRVRASPDDTSNVIGKVPNRGKIKVIRAVSAVEVVSGRTGQWVEVAYQNTRGYAFSGFLLPVGASDDNADAEVDPDFEWRKVRAKPNLNIRSAPDVTGAVITKVDNGKVVKLLERVSSAQSVGGETGYWVKVEANGKIGFVFDAFLE